MSIKVVFIGARLSDNFGGPSLLFSIINILNKTYSDIDYIYISPAKEDVDLSEEFKIPIISAYPRKRNYLKILISKITGIKSKSAKVNKIIDAISESDIIIDIWGIAFADSLGSNSIFSRFFTGLHYLFGKLFKKPFIKYTSDLGSFNKFWNRFFANFYLNKINLIMARSEITKKELEGLGIRTQIKVYPDSAFVLPIDNNSLIAEELAVYKGNKIGLSVSFRAAKEMGASEDYINIMASFIDFLIESYDSKVILIPNEQSESEIYDDNYFALEIYKKVLHVENVYQVYEMGNVQKLKGIIGCCDVVVAARYHSIIAALSQDVPVLAIGWHHKYVGAMELFNQEDMVISVDDLSIEELENKFECLWVSRNQRAQRIREDFHVVQKKVFDGASEVQNILMKEKRI